MTSSLLRGLLLLGFFIIGSCKSIDKSAGNIYIFWSRWKLLIFGVVLEVDEEDGNYFIIKVDSGEHENKIETDHEIGLGPRVMENLFFS